jgi:hypothetical protein
MRATIGFHIHRKVDMPVGIVFAPEKKSAPGIAYLHVIPGAVPFSQSVYCAIARVALSGVSADEGPARIL